MTENVRRAAGGEKASAATRELHAGLTQLQKQVSPKYFYDERGSALFERITALPEYYLTRTERALLSATGAEWLARERPPALVELGAGSAEKTRILLAGLQPGSTYVPVDISAEFLEQSATRLRREFPQLRIEPVVADITQLQTLPPRGGARTLYAFLGSTLGNFDDAGAVQLLQGLRRRMRSDDTLLMGVDLAKDPAVLEAAYNDREGVTAAFNLNLLSVLNHEFGTDFDLSQYRHRAHYNAREGCIEMHLVALTRQRVRVPGCGEVVVQEGESIRTEISCKYTRERVERILFRAGLELRNWETDARGRYALLLAGHAAGG